MKPWKRFCHEDGGLYGIYLSQNFYRYICRNWYDYPGRLTFAGYFMGKKGPLNYIFGSIVCIAVGIFLIFVSRGGTLKIDDKTVNLKIPMFSKQSFSFDEISNVAIVDLNTASPYLPIKKKSGAATKNFKSGWFQLKNGEKVFLLLEGSKAIYIKTANGDAYLIGIKKFDDLVEKFKPVLKEISVADHQ